MGNSTDEKPRHPWGVRLADRLENLGWSSTDLAHRMIESGLPYKFTSLKQNIEKYRSGYVGQPRGQAISDIAKTIGVTENWLRTGDHIPGAGSTPRAQNETLASTGELSKAPPVSFRQIGLPILGRPMAGKEGAMNFSSNEPIDHTDAPAAIADVPDAYAVYVTGDSMEPVYSPGTVLCVHPYLPPKRGDDVVIQLSRDDGSTIEGYVKRFISMDDKVLKLRQFNPDTTLRYPRAQVIAVHTVVWVKKAR